MQDQVQAAKLVSACFCNFRHQLRTGHDPEVGRLLSSLTAFHWVTMLEYHYTTCPLLDNGPKVLLIEYMPLGPSSKYSKCS